MTKGTPKTANQGAQAHARATIAAGPGQGARDGAKAPRKRGASAEGSGPVRTLTPDEIARLSYAAPALAERKTAHSKRGGPAEDNLEAERTRFLREHLSEARRQRRETRKEARRNKSHLIANDGKLDWLIEKHGRTLPKKPKAKGHHSRKTSIQRAAAHARGEIGNAIREQALSLMFGVKVPTAGKPTRSDLDRLEQVQRAVSMVTAAREFYALVKRMFPRRSDLEKKLGPLAEINRAWLERYKLVYAQVRAGKLSQRDLIAACRPPAQPAELGPLKLLAAAIPPRTGGALKDLAAERGPRAGGGWLGNVRLKVTVAGFWANGRSAVVNCTRTVNAELLAPDYLSVLYAAGPRSGPAAAAKAVVGAILKRSRQALESMVANARAADFPDTA